MALFIKLGIEIEFITFHSLANEYMAHWNKKDPNQIPRTTYWLDVFGKKPIKAITTNEIRKQLDHYANGKVLKGHSIGLSKAIAKNHSSNTFIRLKSVLSSILNLQLNRVISRTTR